MKQTQIGNITKITATSGYIHKIGTDTYAKSIIMLPSDTVEMYEEVDSIPPYTKDEYDNKVAELVREKYTESEEFAIQRKAINAAFSPSVTDADSVALEEYQEYNAFVEQCKVRAKELLINREPEGDNVLT